MALHFELVTPDRQVMSEDVHMVVVPGTEGESGIMAGHAPYMTTLKNGELAVYRTAGAQPERIAVTGGFAEMGDKGLTVLAESVADHSSLSRAMGRWQSEGLTEGPLHHAAHGPLRASFAGRIDN